MDIPYTIYQPMTNEEEFSLFREFQALKKLEIDLYGEPEVSNTEVLSMIIRPSHRDKQRNSLNKYIESKKEQSDSLIELQKRKEEIVEKVIRHNTGFVISEANKILSEKHYDQEDQDDVRADLISNGLLGLMRAVENFDPDLGVPFISYAGFSIRSSMVVAGLQSHPIAIKSNLNFHPKWLRVDDDDENFVLSTTSDPSIDYEEREAIDNIRQEVEKLDPIEAYTVLVNLGFDCRPTNMEKIGQDLGLARTMVQNINKIALSKIATEGYLEDYKYSY